MTLVCNDWDGAQLVAAYGSSNRVGRLALVTATIESGCTAPSSPTKPQATTASTSATAIPGPSTSANELGRFLVADEFSTDWSVAEDPASRREAGIDRFACGVLLPDPWAEDDLPDLPKLPENAARPLTS